MAKQKEGTRRVRDRVRDFVVYVVISAAIAASAIVIGWSQATTGHPSASSLKWCGRAVAVVSILWWAVSAYKLRRYKLRRRQKRTRG
jgi:hypothetical protein